MTKSIVRSSEWCLIAVWFLSREKWTAPGPADGLVGDGPCRVEGERQLLKVVLWFPMMHVCHSLVTYPAIIVNERKQMQKKERKKIAVIY